MQVFLPSILDLGEERRPVPASLQDALLRGAEYVYLSGPWGYLLQQRINGKGYTFTWYDAEVKPGTLPLQARANENRIVYIAAIAGALAGDMPLETYQHRASRSEQDRYYHWVLPHGSTALCCIEIQEPHFPLQGAATFMPRASLQILFTVKEQLSRQVLPALFIDGITGQLLQSYSEPETAPADRQLLLAPPFHFTAGDLAKIRKAKAVIDASFSRKLSLPQIARLTETNTDLLKKGFKYVTGETVHQYWLRISLEHAASLLKAGGSHVKAVAASCGFESYPHFIQAFKRRYGLPPLQWRKANTGINHGR